MLGNRGEVPAVVQLIVDRLCEWGTGHYGEAVVRDILPHNGVGEEKNDAGSACKRKGSERILCLLYRIHRMWSNFYEPCAFDVGAPSGNFRTGCALCDTAKEEATIIVSKTEASRAMLGKIETPNIDFLLERVVVWVRGKLYH